MNDLDRFFDAIDHAIRDLAGEDKQKRELLTGLVFRILAIIDGVEGPDLEWRGLKLVSADAQKAQEINDDFLHDLWAQRK